MWLLQIEYNLQHLHQHEFIYMNFKSFNVVIDIHDNIIFIDINEVEDITSEWIASEMRDKNILHVLQKKRMQDDI